MRSKSKWKTLFLPIVALFLAVYGCADNNNPTNAEGEPFGTEAIGANDRYIVFTGSTWSNVTFPHLEHSEREGNDCFICHDHGASIGASKWNCSACHAANDPENLCDQDSNHGCVMAQCDYCHTQRGGSAPAIDCTGEGSDIACCTDCHISGQTFSTGVLLDSAVEGVTYQTPTISGTTDSEGTFLYQTGEIVSFSIAGLILGQAIGGPIRTIVDLVAEATDSTHPTVTNISRLLITLDQDGDPDNGITLNVETTEIIEGRAIDFEQSTDDFTSDSTIQSLLNALNNAGVFTSNTPRVLCSAEDAQSHIADTLYSLNSKPIVTFPGGLSVSESSGCNATGCHSNQSSVNGTYQIDETNYSGGIFNDKPIYKQNAGDHWIYWNTVGTFGEWQMSEEMDGREYKHHYSRDEIGGANDFPPIGNWSSGCSTYEGRQISAKVSPLGGISGQLLVGEELSGSYNYYDDEDEESGTTFQWYWCDDIYNTNDVPINGANSTTYTLSSADEGKYIRFGVTPGAATGDSPGIERISGPTGPIIVNRPPYASSVIINGSANVGTELTGYYEYNDTAGDEESSTVLSWYCYDDQSGSNEVLLCEGASDSCLNYTLVEADQDKYIKFVVTPGAATGPSPGIPDESAFLGPIRPDPGNYFPTAHIVSGLFAEGVDCCGGFGPDIDLNGVYQLNGTLNGRPKYTKRIFCKPNCSEYNIKFGTKSTGGCYFWRIEDSARRDDIEIQMNGDWFWGHEYHYTPPTDFTWRECTGMKSYGNNPDPTVRLNFHPNGQNEEPSGITGNPFAHSTLTGDYFYEDNEGDPEDTQDTSFQWYHCDANGNNLVPIAGATSSTYTLTANDIGHYLKFAVRPAAQTGNSLSSPPDPNNILEWSTSEYAGIGPVIGIPAVFHATGNPAIDGFYDFAGVYENGSVYYNQRNGSAVLRRNDGKSSFWAIYNSTGEMLLSHASDFSFTPSEGLYALTGSNSINLQIYTSSGFAVHP